MKKLLTLLLLLFLPLTASADVHRIADESALPADWADKPTLRMVITDTNRSDAILLMCGGEAIMVDGGFNTHYKRVFQTLDDNGVTQLKFILSTHCDGDHSSGITSIINSDVYTVGELLSPNPENYDDPDDHQEKMVRAARKHGVPYRQIDDGDAFTFGDASLTIIRCGEKWGQNNRSAASMVTFGESRLLLLADVSNRVLKHFVDTRDAADFQCDIMKAPHHGIDGVVDEFLAIAQPEQILCTNCTSYDHDKKLEQLGALYSGDGTVTAVTDGTDWYIWQDANWVD